MLEAIGALHPLVALPRVSVDLLGEPSVEERDEMAERSTANEPLVVGASRMVVGPVESGTGDDDGEKPEERFVSNVHADGDRRVATVSAEAALADEDADQEATLELWKMEGIVGGLLIARSAGAG